MIHDARAILPKTLLGQDVLLEKISLVYKEDELNDNKKP
jgi:hypothetical protein